MISEDNPLSGPTPDAGLAMLRGGAIPATAVIALVTVVSARWGSAAVLGAIAGGLLVLAAMPVGPLLLRATRDWSPPAVMAVAVMGYSGAVIALGAAYLLLSGVSWLAGEPLGVSMVAGTIGWLVGQARAAARLRVLAFGDAAPPRGGERS